MGGGSWQTAAAPEDEEEEDDDDMEGDHALCVPEELEGRLGLHSLPATSFVNWTLREEEDERPPGARFQAEPLARGDDPVHHVSSLHEPASGREGEHDPTSAPDGASIAGLTGILLGRSGISCSGDTARGGSSELSFASDSEESYPDIPSEIQDDTVPSDEESRPRPPPYAAHVALMRWPENSKSKAEDAPGLPAHMPSPSSAPAPAAPVLSSHCAPRAPGEAEPPVDREEEEWMARKRLTGAIGRLVQYREGSRPADDILGLCRTRYGRIKVTALRHSGTAQSAGVEVGDQLISIDGHKPSEHCLAENIRTSLSAPSTLIFLGFAGKLQAEVRVRQPDEPRCGLPHFTDVANTACDRRPGAQVELCDTVVFQQPASSLLLEVAETTRQQQTVASTPPTPPRPPAPDPEEDRAVRAVSRVYELQREDARRLVRRALRSGAAIGV